MGTHYFERIDFQAVGTICQSKVYVGVCIGGMDGWVGR